MGLLGELTVWGGTLDGLRAQYLERQGEPMNERLRNALNWVRDQRIECGGFDSCELGYPAAETTAWAIITSFKTAMCLLFLLGIVGIYARQVNKAGWLGLAGFLLL